VEEQEHKSDRNAAKPKGLLYHYTDQSGLLGILDSKSIWATHIRYLNDASEFIHGINIARQCIKEMEIKVDSVIKEFPDDVSFQNKTQKIGDVTKRYFNSLLNNLHETPVFVTCFFDSEKSEYRSQSQEIGESLDQWREYSKGSSGFSIGFDKNAIEDHIKKRQTEPEDSLLFGDECDYDEEVQRETLKKESAELGLLIIEFIKRLLSGFKEVDEKNRTQNKNCEMANDSGRTSEILGSLEGKGKTFSDSMLRMALKMAIPAVFMKHQAFRNEKEWRMAKIFGVDPRG
jgi:hypothetical protein